MPARGPSCTSRGATPTSVPAVPGATGNRPEKAPCEMKRVIVLVSVFISLWDFIGIGPSAPSMLVLTDPDDRGYREVRSVRGNEGHAANSCSPVGNG